MLEDKARAILGLDRPEQGKFLSMRVENLWRLEGFAPVVPFSGALFIPLGPDLDGGALRDALLTVIGRHEVLRSRLSLSGGRPVLLTDEAALPVLETVEVSRAQIAAQREGAPPSPLSEFAALPVDLTAESGLRCRLFRDEEGDVTLGLTLHHYFGDGWSSQILRREIAAAYAALRQGKTPALGETAQYADYAAAQRQALSRNLTAELDYWRRQLEQARPAKLPRSHLRDTGQMGRFYFGLDESVSARLADIARKQRVSVFAVYLAALQLLQARWSGESRITTAVNTADRARPQFQTIVGYLIASVPVHSVIAEDATLGDFLAAVARSFYDAYAHRDLSYDLYDAVVGPPEPFCPVLFNFIPLQDRLSAAAVSAAPPPAGITAGAPVQRVRVHREIYFCLVETPRGMMGKIYYNLDYFDAPAIRALIGRFQAIVEKMAAAPDGVVGGIS